METPRPKTTGYSFWHTLMKVLLLLVALVLIEEGLFTLLANRQARLLKDELAAARADGYLKTPEQLQQPMPPESQNAAPLYLEAAQQARRIGPPDVLWRFTLGPITSERAAAARPVQQSFEALAPVLREAAKRPFCDYPPRSAGEGVSVSSWDALNALESNLTGLMELQLFEGRDEAAVETFGLLWALDASFRSEPESLIAYRAFYLHRQRIWQLGQALGGRVLLPAPCLRLVNRLRDFDAFPLMERGCALSVAEYGGFLHGLAAGEAPPSWLAKGEAPPSAFLLDQFAPDWLCYVVDHCVLGRWLALKCGCRAVPVLVQLEALSRKRMPTWRRLEQARALEAEARSGWLGRSIFLRGFAAIVWIFQGEQYAEDEADLACAEVALSAGAVATSDWLPKSIADVERKLGRKLPLDPFTGKSLNWKLEGGKLTVSSVGESGKPYPPSFTLRIR